MLYFTGLPSAVSDGFVAYASAFDGLPSIDTPQLLGLPNNCRVAWEKNTAIDIVAGLIELNSTVSINQKSDNAAPLKTVLALWKKLMSGSPLLKEEYQAEKVGSGVGVGVGVGWCGWWACVCGCEAGAARRGAARLHRALAALARAQAQHHAHTPMHKVPEEWQMIWAGPDSPAAYIKEFCHRARSAVSRLKDCQPRLDYMPNVVDLRSFLRPSRVVWALRVRAAAALGCAVHRLALHVKWDCTPEDNSGGDGLIVVGLRVSGCACAGGALHALDAPDSPRATDPPGAAPPLLLRYLPQRAESLVPENSILVPVYTNSSRDELVLEARAPLARSYTRHTALLNAIALYIAPVD